MEKTLASWGPHWFPGVRVPVWEPQGGTIVGGLLSRDGSGMGHECAVGELDLFCGTRKV